MSVLGRDAHDDAAGMQIVIQGFTFPQEFWRKKQVLASQFLGQPLCIPHWHRGFDDNDSLLVHRHHLLDYTLHRGGVKIVLRRVIVCGGGHHHIIRL